MTQTSSTSPSTAHQNVVPSEVGWQFVPQYYTFVNKQPNRLHCFYTKNSTFIHGTEGEDGRPCFGQQEIHQKILSLGFNDCKVFIHSVDAQASQSGGIIIQVIGEMSNNGEPWKKFVQTFFLAEQPNGYFVLNDIFRFLKEESVESEEDSELGTTSATQDVIPESSPVPIPPAEQQPFEQLPEPIPAQPPTPTPPPTELVPEPTPVVEYVPTPVEEQPKPHLNGHVVEPEPVEPSPVVPQEPEPTRAPSPPPSPPASIPVTIPSPPAPSIPTAPPASTTPTPSQSQSIVVPPQPAPPPTPAPPVPKTWANLAATNSKKWGAAVAQESRGTSESAAPSPPASGTQTPVTGHNTRPSTNRDGATHHVQPSTAQVFVKGVTEAVTPQLLTKVMTERFGPLKDLDVVHSKACAFFEFINLDAARRAITTSLPPSQGGEGGIRIETGSGQSARLTVETRKERSERPPPRSRGGPPNQSVGDRGGFRGRGAPRGRVSVPGKTL